MMPLCVPLSPNVNVSKLVIRLSSASVTLKPPAPPPTFIACVPCDVNKRTPPLAAVALTLVLLVAPSTVFAILMSAPRKVTALAVVFALVTATPAASNRFKLPVPSSPAPAAVVSAANEMVPVPVVIVPFTFKSPNAVTSTAVFAVLPVILPNVNSPKPSRFTALASVTEPITTFCWAVFVLSANCIRFAAVPTVPEVFNVTVAPVVAISATALFVCAAVIPPEPAFNATVPLPACNAVPGVPPVSSSNII